MKITSMISPSASVSHLTNTNHIYRIHFMRVSSDLFPFASHAKYGYSLDYAAAELKVRVSYYRGHRLLTLPSRWQETSLMGMATD